MERILLCLAACLWTLPNAFAADTERGVSVYDANPQCKERSTAPNDPACILREEGAPRQFYPPPVAVAPVIPNPPVMPVAPPIPREGNGNNVKPRS